MPNFSSRSLSLLMSCHPDLQRLFTEVVKYWDCTVRDGYRNKEDQDKAVRAGRSNATYPNSAHNKQPSLAVDVYPYPVDLKDLDRFYFFAGYVLGTAQQMGIPVKSGLDWDQDRDIRDQRLIDGPHFELV